jgi:adenine-specific DNA methylase
MDVASSPTMGITSILKGGSFSQKSQISKVNFCVVDFHGQFQIFVPKGGLFAYPDPYAPDHAAKKLPISLNNF